MSLMVPYYQHLPYDIIDGDDEVHDNDDDNAVRSMCESHIHTSVRDIRVCDWLKDHTWPYINTVHGPANNQYLLIFGTIFRSICF